MHSSVSIAAFELLISLQGDLILGFSLSLSDCFSYISPHLNPFFLFSARSVESALLKTKILCMLHKRCCVCMYVVPWLMKRCGGFLLALPRGHFLFVHGKYKIRLGEKTCSGGFGSPPKVTFHRHTIAMENRQI